MTVASSTSKSGPYAGNGATTVFAYSFKVQQAADVKVVRTVTTNGVAADTTLTSGVDYTVAVNADQSASPGGSVTMTAAPAAGQQITILRNVTATQGTSIPNQGGFYPKVVENALDKLTMLVQQLSEEVGRAPKLSVTDSTTSLQDLLSGVNAAVESAQAEADAAQQARLGAEAAAAAAVGSAAFIDTNPIVKGSGDPTKLLRFEVDGITSGQTRVATVPDRSGTLALQGLGASVASAASVNLDTATGDLVHVTGTTTITGITLAAGTSRDVVFDGALTLTHGANLILPSAASITTAAGDRATFRGDGSGVVRCMHYTKANGQAVVSPSVGAGDHEVVVTTGNGHGSTNTRIRRFTTTQTNVGTSITYADSAANGASFTINETGLYAISYGDSHASPGTYAILGVSVNSSQLTTGVLSITAANRIGALYSPDSPAPSVLTRVVKLSAGDVVRPHNDSNLPTATAAANTFFAIRKVGTI